MYAHLDDEDVAADYLHLLRRGSVTRRLAPSEHLDWRRAIRARARADELRVKTWSRGGDPPTVWAVLRDWSLTRTEHERLRRRIDWWTEETS
ncbi:MAG: hypothetical protein WCH31_08590 [Actinomycetes bacterium]